MHRWLCSPKKPWQIIPLGNVMGAFAPKEKPFSFFFFCKHSFLPFNVETPVCTFIFLPCFVIFYFQLYKIQVYLSSFYNIVKFLQEWNYLPIIFNKTIKSYNFLFNRFVKSIILRRVHSTIALFYLSYIII